MEIEYIISIGICLISTYFLVKYMNKSQQKIEIKESLQIENKNSFIKDIKYISIQNRWRIIKENSDSIIFKTRFSWKSWGEYISITFVKKDIVMVTSKPIVKSTILDYGKNMENIKIIKSILH